MRLRQSVKVKYKTELLGRADYSAKAMPCQVKFWSKVQLCVHSLVSAKVQKLSEKTMLARANYSAKSIASQVFLSAKV